MHVLTRNGVGRDVAEQWAVQVRRHLESMKEPVEEAGQKATAVENEWAGDESDAATQKRRTEPGEPCLTGGPLRNARARAREKWLGVLSA